MSSNQTQSNTYRSIAKGTAMMGGVQVFNIIVNILRGKLVAMFLGSAGMGVSALLSSSVTFVQQVSSLGLGIATVKEVADAKENQSTEGLHLILSVIRRLLLLTALLGAILTAIMSPWLSEWTFGNKDYIFHFIFLGIMVFFTTMGYGEAAILQGAHALKRVAYSSLVGSCVGLFVGVPLYYFWGVDGIVPAMIALALAIYIFYRYHTFKELGNTFVKFSWKEQSPLAKSIIAFGVISMISSVIGTLTNYTVNAFIRYYGSIEDVGLFQAANSITTQYVGMVFAAMSMDFFPRLSAVSKENEKVRNLVNQQAEVVLLVVSPIVLFMILSAPLLIRILLTDEFLSIAPVMRIMAVGVFFKAVVYPMGYIALAKGDKKTFFWLEGVIGNVVLLILNVVFYQWKGILGLSISFAIDYFLFSAVYLILTKQLYAYKASCTVVRLVLFFLVSILLSILSSVIPIPSLSYMLMTLLFIVMSVYSLRELNKRLDLLTVIKTKFNR